MLDEKPNHPSPRQAGEVLQKPGKLRPLQGKFERQLRDFIHFPAFDLKGQKCFFHGTAKSSRIIRCYKNVEVPAGGVKVEKNGLEKKANFARELNEFQQGSFSQIEIRETTAPV
jgi:hypothetical protein